MLVSAGFDARAGDPIGGLRWSDDTFAEMTRRCVAMADQHCGGKIVSVLEGGYNPAGLASCPGRPRHRPRAGARRTGCSRWSGPRTRSRRPRREGPPRAKSTSPPGPRSRTDGSRDRRG
ncbi:MAG: hypothetical protein R6X21_00540 [Candidatus Aminicenantes bacterium]